MIGQLVIQIVITSLQYVAGARSCRSLLPGLVYLQSGMLVTALVFVGITLIGGFWAAGLTNVINVAVIYVGIVLGAVLTRGQVWAVSVRLSTGLPDGSSGASTLLAVGPALIAAWFLVMITTDPLDPGGDPGRFRSQGRAITPRAPICSAGC